MIELLEAVRGPALGVVMMILLFAGLLVVTAFAALIAQIGLLVRLRLQQPVSVRTSYDEQRMQEARRRGYDPLYAAERSRYLNRRSRQ